MTIMGRKRLALNNCRATPNTMAHVHRTANMCPVARMWSPLQILVSSPFHLAFEYVHGLVRRLSTT